MISKFFDAAERWLGRFGLWIAIAVLAPATLCALLALAAWLLALLNRANPLVWAWHRNPGATFFTILGALVMVLSCACANPAFEGQPLLRRLQSRKETALSRLATALGVAMVAISVISFFAS